MGMRLLAVALLLAGLAGSAPLVPLALAYREALVVLPDANLAQYTITSTNQLVRCTIPTQITLKKNTSASRNFFSCTNNWNAAVTLTWVIASDGGSGVTASGDSGAMNVGTTACRSATLVGGPSQGTFTVVFRGLTTGNPDFYAEIELSGSVRIVNNGAASGGC